MSATACLLVEGTEGLTVVAGGLIRYTILRWCGRPTVTLSTGGPSLWPY